MWQNVVVFVLVGLASIYAGWRLLPTTWCSALGQALARMGKRCGLLSQQQAQWLVAVSTRGGGCAGACASCADCPAATCASRRPQAE